jgi:putative acetyltransferase
MPGQSSLQCADCVYLSALPGIRVLPHTKPVVDGRDKPGHDEERVTASYTLRLYQPSDEDAAIALWQRTWQKTYPSIDFAARVDWWRTRWRNELAPNATVIVAEQDGAFAGFVTIDVSGYLDQLVVGTEHWGSQLATALVDAAKQRAPDGITLLVNKDNSRAIRFYLRNGFKHAGEDVNPTSGRPVLKMAWVPQALQTDIA